MSNADFQMRLQRIGAAVDQQHVQVQTAAAAAPVDKKKVNHGLLLLGAVLMSVGIQVLRYTNENYEMLMARYGAGTLGVAAGGVVSLALAIPIILRATRGRKGEPNRATAAAKSARQSSSRAKTISSLVGLAMGAIACLYAALGIAVRVIETEKAQQFALGSVGIIGLLAVFAVFLGLLAFFVRGYALARIPLFFVLGTFLTYIAIHQSDVDFLEWHGFVVHLQ